MLHDVQSVGEGISVAFQVKRQAISKVPDSLTIRRIFYFNWNKISIKLKNESRRFVPPKTVAHFFLHIQRLYFIFTKQMLLFITSRIEKFFSCPQTMPCFNRSLGREPLLFLSRQPLVSNFSSNNSNVLLLSLRIRLCFISSRSVMKLQLKTGFNDLC